MKIPNLKDSHVKGEGIFEAIISGKTDKVSCAFGA